MPTLTYDVRTRTQKFEQGMNTVSRRLGSAKKLALGFGTALAGGLFVRAAKEALDFADQVQKLNLATGASTQFLSEMRFVAEQSGVEFSGLTKSITFMQDAMVEAEKGMKSQSDAFRKLGVDVRTFKNLRPDEQFEMLVDRLNQLDNQAEKVNVARDIFGRAGADILQMGKDGGAGIRELREEAQRLGLTLSQDMVDSAADANDAINRMNRSVSALTQKISIQLGPSLETLANFMSEFLPPVITFVGQAFDGLRLVILEFVNASVRAWQFLFEQAAKLPDFLGGGRFKGIALELGELSASLDATGQSFADGFVNVAKYNSEIAKIPENIAAVKSAATDEGSIFEALPEGFEQSQNEIWKRIYTAKAEARAMDEEAEVATQGRLGTIAQDAAAHKLGIDRRVLASTIAIGKSAFSAEKRQSLKVATVKGWEAIQKAWASAPFPLNIPAVAFTTGATAANIAGIAGVAHGGLTNVPRESTYLLDQGERILSRSQNRDLTTALATGGVGGNANVSINIQAMDSDGVEAVFENQRGKIMSLIAEAMNDSGRAALV